jgi:hypothetical protein
MKQTRDQWRNVETNRGASLEWAVRVYRRLGVLTLVELSDVFWYIRALYDRQISLDCIKLYIRLTEFTIVSSFTLSLHTIGASDVSGFD